MRNDSAYADAPPVRDNAPGRAAFLGAWAVALAAWRGGSKLLYTFFYSQPDELFSKQNRIARAASSQFDAFGMLFLHAYAHIDDISLLFHKKLLTAARCIFIMYLAHSVA